MEDSKIVLPDEVQSEFARRAVSQGAAGLPLVGTPRDDNGSMPRTIKILPDWSGIIWSYKSVEARGGLFNADGQKMKKLGLKMEMLSPDEMFSFFHEQAINFAEFLHARDEKLAEEEEQAEGGAVAKHAKPSRADRKAKRKGQKRRKQ